MQIPRGLVTDPVPASLPTPVPGTIPPTSRIRLMHIEDDPGIAKSMALLLRLEGYEVISASSRDEALQHVTVHGVRPDLILCDFQLPMGFTGVEIVAEIAAILKSKPPTIMLTGDIANEHVERAKIIADQILPKPVDINQLLSAIEALIAKPD